MAMPHPSTSHTAAYSTDVPPTKPTTNQRRKLRRKKKKQRITEWRTYSNESLSQNRPTPSALSQQDTPIAPLPTDAPACQLAPPNSLADTQLIPPLCTFPSFQQRTSPEQSTFTTPTTLHSLPHPPPLHLRKRKGRSWEQVRTEITQAAHFNFAPPTSATPPHPKRHHHHHPTFHRLIEASASPILNHAPPPLTLNTRPPQREVGPINFPTLEDPSADLEPPPPDPRPINQALENAAPNLLDSNGHFIRDPQSQLSGLLLNTWSLPKHRIEIHDLIEDLHPDLLFLTETWLSGDCPPVLHVAIPDDYNHILANREARAGGVAVIFKKTLKVERMTIPTLKDCEHLMIKLFPNATSCIPFLLIYRPPGDNYSFPTSFSDSVAELMVRNPNLVILGDFNIWMHDNSNPIAGPFLSNLNTLGLTQGVSEPTHKRGRCLDGIFHPPGLLTVGSPTPVPWSDHSAIPFLINTTPKPQATQEYHSTFRAWNKLDLDKDLLPLMEELAPSMAPNLPIENLHNLDREVADELLSNLITKIETWITHALDKLIPLKTSNWDTSSKPKSGWYSNEMTRQKKQARKLLRSWQNDRSHINLIRYKMAHHQYKTNLQKNRKAFYSGRIEKAKCPSKELFAIIQELSKDRDLSEPPKTLSFCTKMATHFVQKESLLHSKINDLQAIYTSPTLFPEPPPPSQTLNEIPALTDTELTSLIRTSKSAGSQDDPCPPKILKKLLLSPILFPYFNLIVNSSITLGIVPSTLKSAHLRPLLKKPGLDMSIGDNFRGINNSKFLAKFIESIMTTKISSFLETHKILDPAQAGFRPKHNTEAVLVAIWDDLKRQADREGTAALVLLDLSAAFDTVDHPILIQRLEQAGIKGTPNKWVQSFLANREVRVSIPPHSSAPFTPAHGVPQGSPLSPLLFNLFLRPLGSIITSHGFTFYNYADDSQVLLKIDKDTPWPTSALTNCVRDIATWMSKNHLLINPSKTEIILFGPPSSFPDPFPWPSELGPPPLPVRAAKSLGFLLNNNLDPAEHANKISQNCFFIMRILRRIIHLFTFPQQVTAVVALILARLDYANAMYAGAPISCINILQRTQNAAARLLSKLDRWEHITPTLVGLHWLPINRRVTYKILCLAFWAIRGTGPQFLTDRIKLYNPTRQLRSANAIRLVPPKVRCKRTGEASFSYQAPRLWNLLPAEFTLINDYNRFKQTIKTWLFISWVDAL